MSEERQKNLREPASRAEVGSEAPDNATRGFESLEAVGETESLAGTERMMEEVLD